MSDKVILWYWAYGSLYFDICETSDWYSDWYYMGGNGECAPSHVEIDGKVVDPDSIPEYRAWKYTQRKKEEAALAEMTKGPTTPNTIVEVLSLNDGERLTWARRSIPETKWREYVDIFGEDRVRKVVRK